MTAKTRSNCATLLDELGLELEKLAPPAGFQVEEGRLGFDGVWRLEPKSGDNQGFFVARLRKPATQEQGPASRPLPPGQPPRFELLPPDRLEEAGVDPSALPGPVGVFGGSLHILPRQTFELLPASLRWQGMYFGKYAKNGEIRPAPRLRAPGSVPVVDLEGARGWKNSPACFRDALRKLRFPKVPDCPAWPC